MAIKQLLKYLLPPIFSHVYKTIKAKGGWSGNYESWEKALADSAGYDSDEILSKVKQSLLKVKSGEAVYERDSVLFSSIEYSWPLLASLMWIAAQNGGNLNLIDFGGSLGSSYYQNKLFLEKLTSVRWNIVEQPAFIACGKENFANESLYFYESIAECIEETKPNTIVLSSVLQYLRLPYDMLTNIIEFGFEFMVFDLMPFNTIKKDRITVQKVDPTIYDASYPCWFLNKEKFLNIITDSYELHAAFNSSHQISLDLEKINYEGFIFRLKK